MHTPATGHKKIYLYSSNLWENNHRDGSTIYTLYFMIISLDMLDMAQKFAKINVF